MTRHADVNPCDYCINGCGYSCDEPGATPKDPWECPCYEGVDLEDLEADE